MKAFFTYFFTVVYFFLSIGVNAQFHFCNNKLYAYSLIQKEVKSCCKKLKKPCKKCKTVKLVVKKSSFEKNEKSGDHQFFFPDYIIDPIQLFAFENKSVLDTEKQNISNHSPPPRSCAKIYIQNCNYRL